MAFRELTFTELDRVAGGYWQSYTYYSTGGQQLWDREWIDDSAPRGPSEFNYDNLQAQSVDPNNVPLIESFLSEITPGITGYDNSYSQSSDTTGYDSGYNFWGSFYDYANNLLSHVPFDATVFSLGTTWHGTMSGNNVASRVVGNYTQELNVNGVDFLAELHVGNAPPVIGSPDGDIVVNGYYWTYKQIGIAPIETFFGNNPFIQSPASSSASGMNDAQLISGEQTEQNTLNTALHDFLNRNGGHYTVSFNGPSGTIDTFDLAEYVNILDKYHLVTDNNTNFHSSTGGTGAVVRLANGDYQTSITSQGLKGYSASTAGLDYLILHEVGHNLQIATSFTNATYNAYMALGGSVATYTGTTGTNGSSALYVNESYVNNITAAVATLIGRSVLTSPGGGYSYSGTYSGH